MESDWDQDDFVSERPTLVDEVELPLVPVGGTHLRNRALLTVLTGPQVGEVYKVPRHDVTIGRSSEADLTIPDPALSRVHARLMLQGASFLLEDAGSTNGTFVEERPVTGRMLVEPGMKVRLGRRTVVSLSLHDALEESAALSMREAALRDRLTGVYNRGVFDDRLTAEVAFALRHGSPVSLLMFDIDHFKRFNDTYGHVTGDKVLAAVGRCVQATVRTEDIVARYGGEEFAVIARGTSAERSLLLGERLRQAVARSEVLADEKPLSVTISLGIATMAPGLHAASGAQLLEQADRALYAAKRRGRNRVIHSQQVDTSE